MLNEEGWMVRRCDTIEGPQDLAEVRAIAKRSTGGMQLMHPQDTIGEWVDPPRALGYQRRPEPTKRAWPGWMQPAAMMLAGFAFAGYVIAVYTIKPSPHEAAIDAAKATVANELLVPASAVWEEISWVEGMDDGVYVISGHVVSQNAFGVSVPTRFAIDVAVSDNQARVIRREIHQLSR